ncbi:hypothetical protein ALC53_12822 [Atta colombica]|uniref:Uncharacterized protein n=1 Tax=Atta colombica TaxID=520822 RepID=A0A151HYF7_9HYME|nr:hypothetical protein ALC53_12822 [Atta colombica]
MSAREEEFREKRKFEKRWQDSDTTSLDKYATNTRQETMNPPPLNFDYALSRETPARNNFASDESPGPKISFRKATELIPYFDDYNISLGNFTRACRKTREIQKQKKET